MDNKIFRKVSVERLSSPENLDQMMRVVPAKNWIALACLLVLAAVIVTWALLGEIPRQVEGSGMLSPVSSGASQEVVAVFSAEDGRTIRLGMDAFAVFPSQNNTVIAGRIAAVLPEEGEMIEGIESISTDIVMNLAAKPGDILALVRLDAAEAARAGKMLAAGEPCRIEVTVERFHPVRLILPD